MVASLWRKSKEKEGRSDFFRWLVIGSCSCVASECKIRYELGVRKFPPPVTSAQGGCSMLEEEEEGGRERNID
jgi:hypothetical protein